MPDRIQKILSAHGIASRREAERMILDGRVTVDGRPASLGQQAIFGVNEIAIDGIPLDPAKSPVYIMLNKPRGYITSASDERGRKTVMDLVAGVGLRVYPVGRLDMDSEGLLLLTNDGKFANSVAHPSFNKLKTYEAEVRGDVARALPMLSAPMEIGDRTIVADSSRLVKETKSGGILEIAIHEGRNRQIRKMCAKCGLIVVSLRRVAIGSVTLGMLKPGQWRYLTEEEVQALVGPSL